ncbi:MAG TPA: MFS transporter [Gaiellaceae bacterium]
MPLRDWFSRFAIDLSPIRDYPHFRRLWIGQSISFIGGEITIVAMPFQVYELTHSTLVLGLFSLTQLVPLLALTAIGGAFADARDRRRLLLVTETAEALAVGGLAVNAVLPHPSLAVLFALATVASSCFSVGVSAMRALPARLVPEEAFVAASSLDGIYYGIGGIAGPAVAGLLIKFVGLTSVYAIDSVSFAASLVAISGLPPMPPLDEATAPGLRAIREAFRFLVSKKAMLGFFLVDTNAMVFGMPLALFPAIADRRFGDATLVGYLYAAPAAGALVASLASGWASHARRQGVVVVVAASAWGGAIALFAFADRLWLALLLIGLAGLADQISAIFRNAMLLAMTPDGLRGRMLGLEFMQVASAPSLGNLEAGALASLTSIRFSVASGGLLCIVGCLATAIAFPALLRYERAAAA